VLNEKPMALRNSTRSRLLVNVTPATQPTRWAIWRLYPDRAGLVDYLGSVDATSRDGAEVIGRREFGCDPGDEIDVQQDDEKT
jgi:hypothetical protein